MKIQLIHPPADEGYDSPEAQWLKSAPIGLELMAKALGNQHEVEIIDGSNMTMQDILAKIEGDYVGVSDWYSKHQNALRILRAAKKKGAVTLIGGPNASHLAQRILKNHYFVDYAVIGDGEEAIKRIVSGEEIHKIPNLAYRKGEEIIKNPVESIKLDRIFDLDHIISPNYSKENAFPISSIRGCIKAELDKRCSFCSMDRKLRIMDAKNVWKQIDLLRSRYGFDYFFETGDSFIVGKYPEILLKKRPKHLANVRFRIYAGPDQIDEEIMKTLKQLNVKEIFLGVESSNQDILNQAGKNHSVKRISSAIEVIYSAGLEMQVSFIYGLPNESDCTMDRTYQYAKDLMKKYPKTKLLVSTPIPLIGSALFEELRNDQRVRNNYDGDLDADDSFDYQSLIELQTEYRTSTSYSRIMEYVARTRALAKEGNVAGCGILKK
jgi:radical SAM superfamily enzyme YgiQ (UPF0313 family)